MLEMIVSDVITEWAPEQLAALATEEFPDFAVVRLRARTGEGAFDIFISARDAEALRQVLSGEASPRPMTHDLYRETLDALDTEVEQARITRLQDGIYYAEIGLKGAGKKMTLSARPSDAINLALRAGAPIFAAEDVVAVAETVSSGG